MTNNRLVNLVALSIRDHEIMALHFVVVMSLSGIKPFVVISESNLGDIKHSFYAPLADIDLHVHRPKQSFYSACRLYF
jgi:hypothetical protein